MHSNKKVAFIDLSYQKGGTQRTFLYHILNFEHLEGYIFARERSIFKEFGPQLKEHRFETILTSNNIPFKRLKKIWKLKIPLPSQAYLHLSLILFLQKHLSREVDIVVGSAFFSNVYAYILSRINKTKFIAHLNDSDLISKRGFYILQRATLVIAISKFLKKEVVSMGIPEHKVKVVYPTVQNIPELLFNKTQDKPTIGFVGRLSFEKGAHIFLNILEKRKDIKGVMAGELPDKSSKYSQILLKKINKLQEENRLEYLGYKQNISDILKKITVLLYPSLVNEGFGRTILEALYSGIPVIGSNLGAIPEVLENVPYTIETAPTVEDFDKALDTLLSKEISPQAIRESALKKFPPGKSSKYLEELLLEYLN